MWTVTFKDGIETSLRNRGLSIRDCGFLTALEAVDSASIRFVDGFGEPTKSPVSSRPVAAYQAIRAAVGERLPA